MASTLQELRKRAGYDTAKEFAEALGVPATTYVGWESKPERIPLRSAWRLADWFKCTIDVIVGREETSMRSLRGDVQEAYDSLGPKSQDLLDHYLYFLLHEESEERRRTEEAQYRRWEMLCQEYEDHFFRALQKKGEFAKEAGFASESELRRGFESFLHQTAEHLSTDEQGRLTRGMSDEERIAKIMEVYDDLHPSARQFIKELPKRTFKSYEDIDQAEKGAGARDGEED